ncbi:hypothetical protein [Mesorhizobium sp.]|uniref:hypothetical protein n=1 Tax=Mesorhizobium sp. TaxID=1871066 RepID=UPI00257BF771|nr:hypothetical protein [Mesorhizobium sp.]
MAKGAMKAGEETCRCPDPESAARQGDQTQGQVSLGVSAQGRDQRHFGTIDIQRLVLECRRRCC